MSDLPTSLLAQQAHAQSMRGEELEVLGKQAAKRYLTGQGTLTESVVETVKQAGLSPEQVRRVVEFANTDAFLQEFKKEGRAHRVVEFDGGPADFAEVLKDLNDGGGGTVFDKHAFDYSTAPKSQIELRVRNQETLNLEDSKLASAFAVSGEEIPYADPLREAYDAYVKLSAAQEELAYGINQGETLFYDVSERLFSTVKQASTEGTTLGNIVSAWSTITDNPEFVKAAFQHLSPRLLENGVYGSKDEIGKSLLKTASTGILNRAHPLISEFGEFCGVLQKLAEDRAAQEEVNHHHAVLDAFLKEAGKLDLAKKSTEGLIPKVLDKAEQLSHHSGTAGKNVGEYLFGTGSKGAQRTESVARGAVKYAPHIAAGLAAESGYQHAKYNPAVVAAKNFVKSRIPYTHENQIRQYNMQMGGM